MEERWNYFLICSIVFLLPAALFVVRRKQSSASKRLPQGPPGWPVFGNLFDLGSSPHISLANLKQTYGPIIWLKLGATNTMALLTSDVVTEFFKNHDLAFADRTITDTMKSHDYHKGSLALAPYGAYWRMLRRISTIEMFVNKRINETADVRQKCVNDLLQWIDKEVGVGVHVSCFLFLASFNILGNLIFSRDLVDPGSEMGSEFFIAMSRIMDWAGRPNVSDIFPWLRRFDLQGLRKKMDRDKGTALRIASGFVKTRLEERQKGGERRKDFLDVLLDFEGNGKDEPKELLEQDINTFILEVFMAGSETTSSTVEWALTELLRNPEKMIKAKAELAMTIGPHSKFNENHIDNLPYLQAVIKETLRLHPPVPFLVPRKACQDTEFMGHHIPKNTQVFINVWAIGRDPECWDNPLAFNPERFLDAATDYNGQHFELIPFGSGRRMCPGIPLAHRMMPLVLGSILHDFSWELDGNLTPERIDMTEKMGMTMRKSEPLKAVPKKIN